ncbi:MAG: hypothetical protein MJZ33_08020 [Paludibacteraceae bacterium]|nr:hypothetical protein [Paludibacteraceae bacterium]
MKVKFLSLVAISLLFSFSALGQKSFDGKIVTEIKEWKIEGKKKFLDQVTKYDDKGNKTEEIEYSSNGDMRSRVTYEYNAKGKCTKETHYDETNKLKKTVTFEFHENGKKKSQSTFLPNGKLKSTKEFEYVLK